MSLWPIAHGLSRVFWWHSWHQNGWSKNREMVGNVCVSTGQNLATGKWGESPPCATYHKCTWWGICTLSNITSAVVSWIQTRRHICSQHSSFWCMWHLFPVISSLRLTIAAILSHSMQLSQEMMACLTWPFPNELNAGYFGALVCNYGWERSNKNLLVPCRILKGW